MRKAKQLLKIVFFIFSILLVFQLLFSNDSSSPIIKEVVSKGSALIEPSNSSEFQNKNIYFYSQDEKLIQQKTVQIPYASNLPEELFKQWLICLAVPDNSLLNSFADSVGYENEIEIENSTIIEFTPAEHMVSLDISDKIYSYIELDTPVLDSLVRTIKEAYDDTYCILVISVENEVIYSDLKSSCKDTK